MNGAAGVRQAVFPVREVNSMIELIALEQKLAGLALRKRDFSALLTARNITETFGENNQYFPSTKRNPKEVFKRA
jgi:hypothetical protein